MGSSPRIGLPAERGAGLKFILSFSLSLSSFLPLSLSPPLSLSLLLSLLPSLLLPLCPSPLLVLALSVFQNKLKNIFPLICITQKLREPLWLGAYRVSGALLGAVETVVNELKTFINTLILIELIF